MNFNFNREEIVGNIKKLNYKDLIIFLIPFIIFMYYLYIFNPGILTFDSYYQLNQIANNHFNNWHPFFHTFIEMICLKIYPNTKSICILQILVFSIIWMVICKYHRDDNEKPKHFIIQVILTLIISLIPINAIYSITLWKDILFSYFLLLACFLIEVLIDKNNYVSYLFIIIFSLTMAFICQLRPNGLIIISVLLVFLAVYLFKKNRNNKFYILIPALTIIFILMISSLNVAYDVDDTQKDVIFDKTGHILAFYDLNINMTDDDRHKVHEMVSKKDMKHFNIYSTDSIYAYSNKSAYDADKSSYIQLTVKYSLQNPLKFLEYILESSNMVFDITRDDDWKGSVYKINLESSKDSFYEQFNTTPTTTYDNVSSKNIGTPEFKNLKSYAYYFKDNIILDTLFDSPAFYMYLSFIILGLLFIITRCKEIFLIYLPCLLNIITIIASTPYQGNRYLYPNLLVFYLFVMILIRVLTSVKS